MQKIRLERSDRDDLVFTGRLVASVDNQEKDDASFRLLKLALYKTSRNAYIIGIVIHGYSSTGPEYFTTALAFDSLDDIRDFLCCDESIQIASSLNALLRKAVTLEKITMKNTLVRDDSFNKPQEKCETKHFLHKYTHPSHREFAPGRQSPV